MSEANPSVASPSVADPGDAALEAAQQHLGRALDRARAGEDRELAGIVREAGERVVRIIAGLLRLTRVHALDNHAFDQPVTDLHAVMTRLMELLGAIHIAAVEDQIYINDIRMRSDERAEGELTLGQDLRRHGIGGISFHAVPTDAQIRALTAALGAKPVPHAPRAAIRARLDEAGLGIVELSGVYRFRVSGEEAHSPRPPGELVASATALLDVTCENMGKNRLPNPLPLRRVVTEMLEVGAEGMEWAEAGEHSPASGHSMRVCRYSLMIGHACGFSEATLQDLGVAAMFHDVGYSAREGAVPATARSAALSGYAPPYARHAAAGARLLLKQRGFHEAKIRRALAALEHHADYDVPGGPPALFARVIRIAEDFDNLVRVGGRGLPPGEAVAYLAAGSGTRYDPVLLGVFLNLMGRWPPGTELQLGDGRVVQSVGLARGAAGFAKPLTRVVFRADGTAPEAEESVDLLEEGEVVGPYRRPAPFASGAE